MNGTARHSWTFQHNLPVSSLSNADEAECIKWTKESQSAGETALDSRAFDAAAFFENEEDEENEE